MKEFVNSLFTAQKYLMAHDNIKTVSVAKNGVITVVFDNGVMSESDCKNRMKEYGIENYEMSSDWRSNTIFVKIKPE